jgi:magnesium-transporting ATPase (P-type)
MTDTANPGPLGLTSEEAASRLRKFGPNLLPAPRPPSALKLLLAQVTHFFAVLLWVASLLAFLAGTPQLALAIVAVIILNGLFAFLQEYRANRAAQELHKLVPRMVRVIRDGQLRTIDAAQLVPGDTVVLSAGDRVPADLVLLEVHELALDVSTFTGESLPVNPASGETAYAGTFVVKGYAVARVDATGNSTRLAQIAALTRTPAQSPSPLARELDRIVRTIATAALTVGLAFFVVSQLAGLPLLDAFIFTLGVTVALVPEGLLPTLTLSLAVSAQRMAGRRALVRRLESVEVLGLTTAICTDKTGTLTLHQLQAVAVWTPLGTARVSGSGYDPTGNVEAPPELAPLLRQLAWAALASSEGSAVLREGRWVAEGDPLDAALWVLARRIAFQFGELPPPPAPSRRYPFDPQRKMSSVVVQDTLIVKGAPETVVPLCTQPGRALEALEAMAHDGLRVIAIARRNATNLPPDAPAHQAEQELQLLALIGLEDPIRPEARGAVEACRRAGIRVIMVTGDHPATAEAVARKVGLIDERPTVLTGDQLPSDDALLRALIDREGVVIARVTPEDKLRIARVLRQHGHVVAMTGDGVNDAPALHEADVGVAMGQTGTDVAREAADLILLDDNFATIVAAIELGRASYANIRRFLTYHLTDNVAELAPFVVWALSGGRLPLALGVLQILALDLGTDALPALALGVEPPSPHLMTQPPPRRHLIDRAVLRRAFGTLGPVEALMELVAFFGVLYQGGWIPGTPFANPHLLPTASGAAFAAVVFGQAANAFACRRTRQAVFEMEWMGNKPLLLAVSVELLLLACLLFIHPLAAVMGHEPPPTTGWFLAALAAPAVLVADTAYKLALRRFAGLAKTNRP